MCTMDYVLIMTDDTAMPPTIATDRYCGNALATMAAPHLVRCKTDSTLSLFL